jgi:large subunit ribosomal protein L18
MDKAKTRIVERQRRAFRIRKKISGTSERPRLCVRRSLKHIFAQIVDDANRASIAQVGSTSKEVRDMLALAKEKNKKGVARIVGEVLAEKAKAKGVSKVVFDRKGYAYHGRVRALADGARAKGLVF